MKSRTLLLGLALIASGCGDDASSPTDPDCPVTSNVLAACVVDPPGNKVRLTVVVNGGDEVQFYDNQNVLHRCGTLSPSQDSIPSCTADFFPGSLVRIQRTQTYFGNPRNNNEEAKWRLYLWGGDCLGIDANTEPRGGICTLTMDRNKNVVVGFERRPRLWIQHVMYNPMSIRWQLAYSPQKAGGNSTTRAGEFDCNSDTYLPMCEIKEMYYDVGTVITVTAGSSTSSQTPAYFKNWGVGCVSTTRVCTVTLTNDLQIVGVWGF